MKRLGLVWVGLSVLGVMGDGGKGRDPKMLAVGIPEVTVGAASTVFVLGNHHEAA